MTIQNGFFKSINGDRRYLAEFFTSYFASFIGNGVFPNPSTNLQVIANQNFSTIVRPGKGWINGHYLNNDDNIVINHQPSDGVLRRIDRIVFAVNLDSRSMDIYLKQGTPSTNAQAPALLRNSTIYELALADIAFNPGMVSISQSNITDQRMNGQLCGIVHGVVEQLDTTTLFNQYQQFLVEKGVEFDQQLAVNQQVFDDWFAQLNDILDGDAAANLANMIITHTNNATSQKHIEVVSNIPRNLANKGLLLQIDDLDNPNNAPEIPTSIILDEKIEVVTQQFTQQINQIETTKAAKTEVNDLATNKADKTYVDNQLTLKANQAFVDSQLSSIVSGSPKGTFTDLNSLKSTYPNGAEGVFLTLSNGHWYYWNELEQDWIDGGVYQSTGIDVESVKPENTTFIKPSSNLLNINTITLNKIINTNLEIVDSENYNLSDFIAVEPNTEYWSVGSASYTEIDVAKQPITRKSVTHSGGLILTGATTRFIRLNLQITSAYYSQARLNKGTDAGYEPFNLYLKDIKVDEDSIENNAVTTQKLANSTVTTTKLVDNSVTKIKRTALGELPLISLSNSANSKINLSTSPLELQIIGTAFIFHRDKRYTITDQVVPLVTVSAGYVIFYNTRTGVLTSRLQTSQATIADEDNIMLAVVYRRGTPWRVSINAEYTVDGKPIYMPYSDSGTPADKPYKFSLNKINGSVSDSEFHGVGDADSPFDYTNDNHVKVYGLFDALVANNTGYITKNELGVGHENIPINEYVLTPVRTQYSLLKPFPTILLGAAVHGGEGLAVATLYYFFKRLTDDWQNDERLNYLRHHINFKIVPLRNPGAYDQKAYVYPNGVNINRNFGYRWENSTDETKGTAPFSELETQIQRDWIIDNQDALMQLDLHVRGGRQLVTDDRMMWLSCSTLEQIEIAAETIENITNRYQAKYPELRSVPILGYATRGESNGTLRSYAYNELGINTITWEGFSRSTSFSAIEDAKVVNMNVDFLIQMVVDIVKRYQ